MISPLANIHPGAKIGNNVTIDPFAVVEDNTVIGDGTHIMSGAVISNFVRMGSNCKVFPHAAVGGIPQDLKYQGEDTTVEIGDNTIIREFVTINRGTTDKWTTSIGKNCLIMAYTHVAHDCQLGDHVILANAVQLAGHVEIGDYAIIGGMTGAIQFTKIGAHTYISGSSGIDKDVPPYIKAGRIPLSYAGVNSIGLQRRGFTTEQVNRVLDIYRIIYMRGLNISQAVTNILQEIPDCAERTEVLAFIDRSKKGILKLNSVKISEKPKEKDSTMS